MSGVLEKVLRFSVFKLSRGCGRQALLSSDRYPPQRTYDLGTKRMVLFTGGRYSWDWPLAKRATISEPRMMAP
jgi:hypothetical protein